MHVAGMADENQDAGRAQHADRQGFVENPAPAKILSHPAAERRPHDRTHDRADAEHRHGIAVALRRIDLQECCLRQRDQPGSATPCKARKNTSSPRLPAAPHSAEASVNPMTETRKIYLM